jgi:cysteine synthase A
MSLLLEPEIVDASRRSAALERLRSIGGVLPTLSELARPDYIPDDIGRRLAATDPDAASADNLWRLHWFNDASRRRAELPSHIVLPTELTGVAAPIIVLLGSRFPLIGAHKVLAAYGCLVPRLVTGRFDPARHRAVWPSTGNYCRGGVAISRILGCRGVAVLPAGMSRERFEWLERWVADPADIIRTPGTESNVKEIYDKCAELARDRDNVVLNQFSEFANYLVHYHCTGRAFAAVFERFQRENPERRLAAFVAATGSAGTLAAGDYLKTLHATKIAAVEALECPTMLCNGFGEHNIQGIGDKHIPLIHNVMNTDIVTAVSDEATDHLGVLFSAPAGLDYLRARRKVPGPALAALGSFGLSSICNILAAVKTARYLGLGSRDVVMTVATDGAGMYGSEREQVLARDYPGGFEEAHAAEAFGRWMLAAGTDHLLETSLRDRQRIFDLGYYTWVEQQGVGLADFTARRSQAWWVGLRDRLASWDALIEEFNARTGVMEDL